MQLPALTEHAELGEFTICDVHGVTVLDLFDLGQCGGLHTQSVSSVNSDDICVETTELRFECKQTDIFVKSSVDGSVEDYEQLADHAAASFISGHRTHFFMVSVTSVYFLVCARCRRFLTLLPDDIARLIRWDHSSAVVSETIPYVTDPAPLLAFLKAFADADSKTRGWDMSVGPTVPEDEAVEIRAKIAWFPDLSAKRVSNFQLALQVFNVRRRRWWPNQMLRLCQPRSLGRRPHFSRDALLGRLYKGRP
jgi:hypothetical protein